MWPQDLRSECGECQASAQQGTFWPNRYFPSPLCGCLFYDLFPSLAGGRKGLSVALGHFWDNLHAEHQGKDTFGCWGLRTPHRQCQTGEPLERSAGAL